MKHGEQRRLLQMVIRLAEEPARPALSAALIRHTALSMSAEYRPENLSGTRPAAESFATPSRHRGDDLVSSQ